MLWALAMAALHAWDWKLEGSISVNYKLCK